MNRFLAAVTVSIFACLASLSAQPSTAIKIDVFGYRTGDVKVAIFSQNPGSSVQLRNTADQVVYTVPSDGGSIASKGADGAPSGDTVWWVDFSPFTTEGSYHLYSPSLAARSYAFNISSDVYNSVTLAALKTFYLQRCNTPKLTTYAGNWADPVACHMGDQATTNASGHQNRGTLDLTGGWHDAGDYNKYAWGAVSSAILQMLRAYEDHPEVFRDGGLNIPESGNGVPDLLDEIKWELDWLLKMQLVDGSVLHQTHVPTFLSNAPPSADTNVRFYHDPNAESTAVLAGTLALASRIFDAEGQTSYAATLHDAAIDAWTWLQPVAPPNDVQREQKVWAAAEVFRADPGVSSAKAYIDGFGWSGRFFNTGRYDTFAALTYVATPGATSTIVQQMRASISAQVDYIFSTNDLYRNGMPDWSYHWGSNAMRAHYGIFLLAAAGLNETGSHTPQECRRHAQDFLHFFHGQNALSMTYLSNMAALGGEHSSWQFYHAWFGDSNNSHSRTNYIGKPAAVSEPDYPYFKGVDNHGINDNKSSTYGPPPGFVPGGPNKDYSGTGVPPSGATHYNRFYRDWNDQTTWTVMTWEITENSIGYQGPYAALASYFMSVPTASCSLDSDCSDGLFCNGVESCTVGACLPGEDPCPGLACDEQTDQCFLSPCDSDGVCEEGEDCNSCPGDCGSGGGSAVCGNGVCEPGENHLSCGGDCRSRTSGSPGKRFTCSGSDCSNAACNADGWSCVETLPAAFCCGDGACSDGESGCGGCQVDCGAAALNELGLCADGADNDCDGLADCLDTGDCSAAPVCEPPSGCNNNGVCEPGEDCTTCANDCAGRLGGKPSGRFCCGNGVSEGPEGNGSVCFGNF